MSQLLYGRNPVLVALKGKKKPSRILISNTMKDQKIYQEAVKAGLKPELVPNKTLDQLSNFKNHQGVLCYMPEFLYTPLEEVLGAVKDKKDSILLMLDGVEDPVNFGSLIRTSSCFGVDGIIIPKNRQVQVTPTVSKVATGAEETLPIVQVTNLSQTIAKLKGAGFWVVAADGKGDRLYDEIDYRGKIVIIIGSEGRGISQLVLKNSDFVARIPIQGEITSLNAAISGALFIAMAVSRRK